MTGLAAWAALPTALLVLLGAGLALTGSLGLLRLGSFYERVHAPTLAATLGTGCIVVASILCFSALQNGPVLQALLIGAFLTVTTPISLIVLIAAARQRNRTDDSGPG
ncbi:MAG: monovalent cation/H(+) antiporter subunit G [Acetobacteraceae bacterium]